MLNMVWRCYGTLKPEARPKRSKPNQSPGLPGQAKTSTIATLRKGLIDQQIKTIIDHDQVILVPNWLSHNLLLLQLVNICRSTRTLSWACGVAFTP